MNILINTGQSKLDLSKWLLYDIVYGCMMPRWSKKRQTSLYTDCLITTNITNDVYNDIAGNVEKWFDMSSYDKIKRKRLLTAKKKQKQNWNIERQNGW